MAQSKSGKKMMNMIYGLGASVVILGALFKIMHWKGGSIILSAGMIVEAIVFAISAFEPVEDELDWSLVYPELAGGEGNGNKKGGSSEVSDPQGMLSQKLDDMLAEAKLDAGLISSLSESIQNFKGAADNIAPAVNSIAATEKYSEQLVVAANQLESLNSLYKVQLESNAAVSENSVQLQEQMQSLASNLSSLNGVYGGMLSAMSTK